MKLVQDWKNAWRWLSVNCMAIAAALQGAWMYLPEDLKIYAPPQLIVPCTIGMLLLGIFGRIVQQPVKVKKKR